MQKSQSQRKVSINLKLITNKKLHATNATRQSFDLMGTGLIENTELKYPKSSPSFTKLEKQSDDESDSPYLLRCKDRFFDDKESDDFAKQTQILNIEETTKQIQGKEIKKYKIASKNSLKLPENNSNSSAQTTSSTQIPTSPFSNNMIANIVLNEKLEQTNLLVNNSITQQSYSLNNKQQQPPDQQQQNKPQCFIKSCSLKHKPALGFGISSEATASYNQLNQFTFPSLTDKIKSEDERLLELYNQNQEQYQIESSSQSPQEMILSSNEHVSRLKEAALTCRQLDNDIEERNPFYMSPSEISQSHANFWIRSLTKYNDQQQQGDLNSSPRNKVTSSNIILNRRNTFQNSPVFAKNNKELFLRSFQNINTKIIQNPNIKEPITKDTQEPANFMTWIQEKTSNYYATNPSNSNQKVFAIRKIKPNASINFSETNTDFRQTSKRFLSIDKLKKNITQLGEESTLQDLNISPSKRLSFSHLNRIENYPNRQISFQNRFRNTSREITSPCKSTFKNTQIQRNHTQQDTNNNLSQILMIPVNNNNNNNQNNVQTIFGISSRPIIPTRLLGFPQ